MSTPKTDTKCNNVERKVMKVIFLYDVWTVVSSLTENIPHLPPRNDANITAVSESSRI